MLDRGDILLKDCETKNSQLVERLDFLCMVVEDNPANLQKAESLRRTVLGELYPYKGRFRRIRAENEHLLACLFSSEPVVQTQNFHKKNIAT